MANNVFDNKAAMKNAHRTSCRLDSISETKPKEGANPLLDPVVDGTNLAFLQSTLSEISSSSASTSTFTPVTTDASKSLCKPIKYWDIYVDDFCGPRARK